MAVILRLRWLLRHLHPGSLRGTIVPVVVVVAVVVGLSKQILQAEEAFEHLFEDRHVALVFDQRTQQSGLDGCPVGYTKLPESTQGIDGLGRGDPDISLPEKPDKSVDYLIHD